VSEQLVELAYELLDAHYDTARLAREWCDRDRGHREPRADGPPDLQWAGHLEYLQRLQRLGRETLASATGDIGPERI
jgi:hypothetical protein